MEFFNINWRHFLWKFLFSQKISSTDRHNRLKWFRKIDWIVHGTSVAELALTSFCEKSCGTSVAQMTEHSTGNRKDLGSIPSGVEAFLFSQKISSIYEHYAMSIENCGHYAPCWRNGFNLIRYELSCDNAFFNCFLRSGV